METPIYKLSGSGWGVYTSVSRGINSANAGYNPINRTVFNKFRLGNGLFSSMYGDVGAYPKRVTNVLKSDTSALTLPAYRDSFVRSDAMPLRAATVSGANRFFPYQHSVGLTRTMFTGKLAPTGSLQHTVYRSNVGAFAAKSVKTTWKSSDVVGYLRRMPWGVFSRKTPDGDPNPNPDPIQNVIPYRKAYVVINAAMLTRTSDNTPIPCWGIDVTLDYQSTMGSFSCTMPRKGFDLIDENRYVTLHVNGKDFKFRILRVSESRKFPVSEFSVTGYTLNCELGKEFLPEEEHKSLVPCTSQQFIDQALGFTGFSTLFDGIDPWQLTPNKANTFGTPLDVAKFVAEGCGGYVLPHPTDKTLTVKPRYPVAPWLVGDSHVDIEIPMSCATQFSLEDNASPLCDAVHVTDGSNYLARVVKQGTIGLNLGQPVVHALACLDAPASAIGLGVIASSGVVQTVGISIPLFVDVPAALPGVIVKLVHKTVAGVTTKVTYGIVRKFSLSVNHPTVRQNLTIEVLKNVT